MCHYNIFWTNCFYISDCKITLYDVFRYVKSGHPFCLGSLVILLTLQLQKGFPVHMPTCLRCTFKNDRWEMKLCSASMKRGEQYQHWRGLISSADWHCCPGIRWAVKIYCIWSTSKMMGNWSTYRLSNKKQNCDFCESTISLSNASSGSQ